MSTLNVSNITDGTDTVETGYVVNGSAKAWAVTRQTGTMALLDSLNIGSITDISVGRTTYNFATSFSSVNYSACGGATNDNNFVGEDAGRSASSILLSTNNHDGTKEDAAYQSIQAHGDLA